MDISLQLLKDKLIQAGLRPSIQRIQVLAYLSRPTQHPTADEIYSTLVAEIPTLSRTTIYNTLNSFVKAGLVRIVRIETAEARYDVELQPHGHFQCEACGAITNFAVNIENIATPDLDRFKIKEKDVYYRGLCPNCLELNKE